MRKVKMSYVKRNIKNFMKNVKKFILLQKNFIYYILIFSSEVLRLLEILQKVKDLHNKYTFICTDIVNICVLIKQCVSTTL